MLQARDNERHTYLEIVDAIRQEGCQPEQDIKELWRRIVLNVLISNTDDHLRNHGFLYVGENGWKLSPAYDLNPVPTDIKAKILSTAIIDTDDPTASIELAMEAANYFNLSPSEAKNILLEVKNATSEWQHIAKKLGIPAYEMDRMASAFIDA
jgi:serine/threonine-protein kinase HipA